MSTAKVRLSGYGVELAVKNTEYKAVDDSKVQGDEDGSVKKESEEENEVDGFLFSRLRYAAFLFLFLVFVFFFNFQDHLYFG